MAWHRMQRTAHTLGRHLGRAVATGARVAQAVDHGVHTYAAPIYQHAVRPLLHAKGIDTGRVDAALNSYNNLRRAIK